MKEHFWRKPVQREGLVYSDMYYYKIVAKIEHNPGEEKKQALFNRYWI